MEINNHLFTVEAAQNKKTPLETVGRNPGSSSLKNAWQCSLTSQLTMETCQRAILSMLSSLRLRSLMRQATFFMASYAALILL